MLTVNIYFWFLFLDKEYYPLMRTDGHVFLRTHSVSHGLSGFCTLRCLHRSTQRSQWSLEPEG